MKELTLDSSVRYLAGVGPKRCAELNKVGVATIRQLLQYYPRDYIFAVHRRVMDIQEGEFVVVSGKLSRVAIIENRVVADLTDETGTMQLVWFNQSFVYTVLRHRHEITVWGNVTFFNNQVQLVNPKHSFTMNGAPASDGSGMPIYPATKNLTSTHIANAVKAALKHVNRWFGDDDMFSILQARGFIMLHEAVRNIHQPCDKLCLKKAKRRLKYEEFYKLMQRMRKQRESQTCYEGSALRYGTEIHKRIEAALKVTPTPDQKQAIADIVLDMVFDRPMYRLLQGDVGCGKTMVAVFAALLAAVNRKQTVILCPTKILARQHFMDINCMLQKSRYRACLLVGDHSSTHDTLVKDRIHSGYYDIVVATTSVLSDRVGFNDLGLLVVDEEHRFGVKQKDTLVEKHHPHQLYMSATPIPKALAATVFGDLDVSTIKTMPAGRGKRDTHVVLPQYRSDMVAVVEKLMENGSQVYDIYPRIDGEGGLQEAWDTPDEGFIGGVAGMIHGKRRAEDNQAILEQFRSGDLNVLMSTSMIEVGVHVPRANVMIVHDAHLFGLSQLHQLRGRIGRCADDSVCYLMCDTDDPEAIARLQFLEGCDDGFEVAEKDLELRGPGELLGEKQHGLPELVLADLITDYHLLMMTKEDVNGTVR